MGRCYNPPMIWQLFISSVLAMSIAPQRLAKITATDLFTGQQKTLSLDASKKGTVVVFLSSQCPCSVDHEQTLRETAERFSDFQFVAVHSNADESVEEAKAHFTKGQWKFPVYQDHGTDLADLFAAAKTPHAFVLTPKGIVVFQGGVTDSRRTAHAHRNFLEETLTRMRKGAPIENKEAKTLGCAISRS